MVMKLLLIGMVYSKSLLILREEEFFCNGYGLSDFEYSIFILACGNEKRVVTSASLRRDVLIGRLDGMRFLYINKKSGTRIIDP